MSLTMSEIQGMVRKAKECGACLEGLDKIESLDSVEAILSHPDAAYWAYWYSFYVIRGRCKEVEDVIKKDPMRTICYAHHVLNKRWIEIEESIKTDEYFWNLYIMIFPEAAFA